MCFFYNFGPIEMLALCDTSTCHSILNKPMNLTQPMEIKIGKIFSNYSSESISKPHDISASGSVTRGIWPISKHPVMSLLPRAGFRWVGARTTFPLFVISTRKPLNHSRNFPQQLLFLFYSTFLERKWILIQTCRDWICPQLAFNLPTWSSFEKKLPFSFFALPWYEALCCGYWNNIMIPEHGKGDMASKEVTTMQNNLDLLADQVMELSSPTTEQQQQQQRRRSNVQCACSNCKKAHLACDTSRPCRRCVQSGKADSCVDVVPKKRGRPPLNRSNSDAGSVIKNHVFTTATQSLSPPKILSAGIAAAVGKNRVVLPVHPEPLNGLTQPITTHLSGRPLEELYAIVKPMVGDPLHHRYRVRMDDDGFDRRMRMDSVTSSHSSSDSNSTNTPPHDEISLSSYSSTLLPISSQTDGSSMGPVATFGPSSNHMQTDVNPSSSFYVNGHARPALQPPVSPPQVPVLPSVNKAVPRLSISGGTVSPVHSNSAMVSPVLSAAASDIATPAMEVLVVCQNLMVRKISNPAGALGYSAASWLNQSLYSFIHEMDRPILGQFHQELLQRQVASWKPHAQPDLTTMQVSLHLRDIQGRCHLFSVTTKFLVNDLCELSLTPYLHPVFRQNIAPQFAGNVNALSAMTPSILPYRRLSDGDQSNGRNLWAHPTSTHARNWILE